MALARCNFVLQDEQGDIVDGASVTVQRDVGGLPTASVFSDRAGVVPLANPYTAADGADAGFFADAGPYRITATLGGFSHVRTYEAVGTAQEYDADDLVPDNPVLTVNGIAPVAGEVTLNADDVPYAGGLGGNVDSALLSLTATAASLIANPSFLVVALTATLTNERVLTAGTGVSFSDAGAGSTFTINASAQTPKVLQVLQNTYATNTPLTTVIPADDTIPTNSEGDQVLSQAITPASSSNKVLVEVVLRGAQGASSGTLCFAVFRDSTCIDAGANTFSSLNFPQHLASAVLDSPATGSAVTYSVRVGPAAAGGVRLNGTTAGRLYGGASVCTLTVTEVT